MPMVFPVQTRAAGHYNPVRDAPAQWVNRYITFTMVFGADATSQAVLADPTKTIPVKLEGAFVANPTESDWQLLAQSTWNGGHRNRAGVLQQPSLGYSASTAMPLQFRATADTPVQFDWGLDVTAT